VGSVVDLLARYARSGAYPPLFPNRLIPGGAFPQAHALPGGGDCVLGVAPPALAPPGRFPVAAWVAAHFLDFGANLSLLSQALFPRATRASPAMPELLLAERIENASMLGTRIRIVVPARELSRAAPEVRSLLQFPNVDVRVANSSTSGRCRLPTFYTFRNVTGFMPMPFEYIVGSAAITFSLHITDAAIAEKLLAHFDAIWDEP
jgi:hypothetical protein